MSNQKKKKAKDKEKKNPLLKPDPETLHTTDPQEEMEGPVSSVVQNIKEEVEENETKNKKDEKKK